MSRPRFPASRTKLGRRVLLSDTALAFAAPFAAYFLRDPNILERTDLSTLLIYAGLSAAISAISFRAFRVAQGMPQFFSSRDAVVVAKASAAAVAATSFVLFSLTRGDDLPRSVPIIHFLLLAAALVATRLARRTLGQRTDRRVTLATVEEEEAVLLVGATRLAWFYVRIIDMFGLGHRRVLGLLDARKNLVGRSVFGHFVLGAPADASQLVGDFAAHGVCVRAFVICERGNLAASALRADLEPLAREHGIAIEMLARQLGIGDDDRFDETVVEPRVDRAARYLRKRRIFDATAAGLALVALSPVLLLVAVSVWTMLDAPVFFWQLRAGRDGRAIHIYKFRSMLNPLDMSGRLLPSTERDAPFGNFLRATRLDELPQLWNVLRGDMALIGPRPLLPVDQPKDAALRLSVAPGITGWAQITVARLVSAEDKNALDEYYVRNASPLLDARILVRTIQTVLLGDRLAMPPSHAIVRNDNDNDDDDDDRKAA